MAALADVSLVRTFDGPDGEPRVALLQTVRDFAVDLLEAAGQLDETRRRHAEHYADAGRAGGAGPRDPARRRGGRAPLPRARTTWTRRSPGHSGSASTGPVPSDRRAVGARLCVALWWFWASQGHVTAGRRWFDLALEVSAGDDSPAMARLHLGKGIWDMWADAPAMARVRRTSRRHLRWPSVGVIW